MKRPALLTMLSAALLAGGLVAAGPVAAQTNPTDPAGVSGVGAVAALNAAAAVSAVGNLYFLDCDAASSGNGSMDSPWNSLTTVNETTFAAGDRLLLKRGSTCEGTLRPLGSGDAQAPIVIDAFGPGEAKPLINGAGVDATVQLSNQQYWEIRNLEITNIDVDPSKHYKNERRGLVVKVQDIGQANHYRIENLNIHDVYGEGTKDLKGSGGIQFEVYASDNNAERVPTWFNDVVIANNIVENVNRSGINMSTRWKCRAEVGWNGCGGEDRVNLPWTPSTGLVIRGNTVKNVGGDGIVVQMNKNALVEYNTVSDTANMPNGSNAGVWAWNADGTTFQYNEVFDTKRLPGNNDGNAFDVDYGTNDTLFQYNYSHDNEGGMMLFCGCGGLASQATFRYNVSENDKGRVNFVAGAAEAEYYNNTIILPKDAGHLLNQTTGSGTAMLMANNLIVASASVVDQSTNHPASVNIPWRNNVFSGPGGAWPADAAAVTIADKLALAAGQGLDRMKISDPRIAAKGLPIAPVGTMDFFGNPVPSSCAPDIGAYQFSAVDDSNCNVDGETITAGSSLAEVPVRTNTTYKVAGTVAAGAKLSVTNPKGFKTPAGVNGEVVFSTAMDASTVSIACEGAGGCSAVSMVEIDDRIVDGSFDALNNTPWTAWNTSRDAGKAVSGSFAVKITGSGSTEQFPVVLQPNTDYLFSGWISSADGTAVRLGLKNFTGNPNPAIPGQFEKSQSVTAAEMTHTTIAFNSGNTKAVTVYCYKPGGTGAGFCDDITMTAATQAPAASLNPEDATVTEGNDAYFFSSFVGAPRTSVLWQANVSGEWTDIAAAEGTALTVPAVTAEMNGTQYRAFINGPTGQIVSESATLTVAAALGAPAITDQPTNVGVVEGVDVAFTAAATANPAASVQWQASSDGAAWKEIPAVQKALLEAQDNTLNLSQVSLDLDGWQVRAIFTNALGSATTEAATLTVKAAATPTPTATATATATPSASAAPSASTAPSTTATATSIGEATDTDAAKDDAGTPPAASGAPSANASTGGDLANTGAGSVSLLIISGGLLVLAGGVAAFSRRRKQAH
ncbi:right-handed parallel beta-helix repeat-containing protein [Arthrobacter sp. E3]|uniref:right-handed parallel beta-helix repeat-containing protein n=1 Tax=Arthrobacter sp. E3 TaxID=517402 RepID=UPI001A949543|nr:right-handed parallel beta-helix repeat-containing protein [Arthrobacter sp. E3]